MKVLLTTPPYDKTRFRLGESLGLKYLAAFLRQRDIDVTVFEPTLLGWNVEQTVNAIVSHGCEILGISVQFSHGLSNVVEVMKRVKATVNPHITIGGHFATFHFDELLETIPQLDSIVMFEGEETFVELIEHFREPSTWRNILGLAFRDNTGSAHRTLPRPLIRNLDALPFPERDATSRIGGDPHFGMITSRGCLMCCSFCSVPFFYGEPSGARWRVRSPQNVVDEMELLVDRYGVQEISFLDDNFLGSNRFGRNRARQFAQEVLARNLDISWSIECRVDDVELELFELLREAGLKHLNLGVESGSQEVLDNFKKLTSVDENRHAISIIRDLGLSAYYHFIMFNANTTFDELETSLKFIEDCGIGSFSVISNRLDIYKGTAEFFKLQKEGRLAKHGYEYKFQFLDPAVELVYQAIHRGLSPLYDIELALQRAIFNENAIVGRSNPRNHFLFPKVPRTDALDQLTNELSDKTVAMAREILRYFLKNNVPSKSSFVRLCQNLHNESKTFSELMLTRVAKLYIEEMCV